MRGKKRLISERRNLTRQQNVADSSKDINIAVNLPKLPKESREKLEMMRLKVKYLEMKVKLNETISDDESEVGF
jgi:hypothetical protein